MVQRGTTIHWHSVRKKFGRMVSEIVVLLDQWRFFCSYHVRTALPILLAMALPMVALGRMETVSYESMAARICS